MRHHKRPRVDAGVNHPSILTTFKGHTETKCTRVRCEFSRPIDGKQLVRYFTLSQATTQFFIHDEAARWFLENHLSEIFTEDNPPVALLKVETPDKSPYGTVFAIILMKETDPNYSNQAEEESTQTKIQNETT